MNKSVNQFTYTEGDQCVQRMPGVTVPPHMLPPWQRLDAGRFVLVCRYVFMNLDSYEETRLPKVRAPAAVTACRRR